MRKREMVVWWRWWMRYARQIKERFSAQYVSLIRTTLRFESWESHDRLRPHIYGGVSKTRYGSLATRRDRALASMWMSSYAVEFAIKNWTPLITSNRNSIWGLTISINSSTHASVWRVGSCEQHFFSAPWARTAYTYVRLYTHSIIYAEYHIVIEVLCFHKWI